MKVRILAPGAGAPAAPGVQYLSSYLVDDVLAIDAGCLGLHDAPAGQGAIRRILLTHAHLDHVMGLPVFLQNACGAADAPIVVYGLPETLRVLREDLFTGRLWPDHPLRGDGGGPCLELVEVRPGIAIELGSLRATPVPVDHVVPTVGWVVDDGRDAVVFGADSGPTERLWDVARESGRVRGVFLEASYPARLGDLAALTGHLTTTLFRDELAKLPSGARVVAVHLSATLRDEIAAELEGLGLARVALGEPGREYRFGEA